LAGVRARSRRGIESSFDATSVGVRHDRVVPGVSRAGEQQLTVG
jgi:hypothetical protein